MLTLLKPKSLTSFRLYFGQKIEDMFLLHIQSKFNLAKMTDFKLRKANQLR